MLNEISVYPKLLRALIKHCTDLSEGLLIIDNKSEQISLIDVNDEFLTITGYTTSEILGKDISFLEMGNNGDEALLNLLQNKESRKAVTVNVLHYKKDGTTFWDRATVIPILDEKKELTHWAVIIRDITDIINETHKRSELDAMNFIVHVVNDIVFNYLNYLQLFRITIEESIDKSVLQEFDENYMEFLNDMKQFDEFENFQKLLEKKGFKPFIDTESN